jgi:hypothetical protein
MRTDDPQQQQQQQKHDSDGQKSLKSSSGASSDASTAKATKNSGNKTTPKEPNHNRARAEAEEEEEELLGQPPQRKRSRTAAPLLRFRKASSAGIPKAADGSASSCRDSEEREERRDLSQPLRIRIPEQSAQHGGGGTVARAHSAEEEITWVIWGLIKNEIIISFFRFQCQPLSQPFRHGRMPAAAAAPRATASDATATSCHCTAAAAENMFRGCWRSGMPGMLLRLCLHSRRGNKSATAAAIW